MSLLMFLCVNLTLLHVCTALCSPEYGHGDNNEKTIFLVNPNSDDSYDTELNNKFYRECKDFYDIKFLNCNEKGVKATIEATKSYTNIIDLNVPDYHKYSQLENYGLVFAGYNGIEREEKVCNVTKSPDLDSCVERINKNHNSTLISLTEVKTEELYELVNDCIKNGVVKLDKCEETSATNKHVKLISNTIADYSWSLYAFVMSMEYQNRKVDTRGWKCTRTADDIRDLDIILICKTKNDYFDFNYISPMLIKVSSDCVTDIEKFRNNLLAIVSPEPFDIHKELTVPTIFYDTSYLDPEILTMFPNSMVGTNLRMLRYAFREFMIGADWMRAAILSDDSLYSIEFEKEIIQMFEEEAIFYTVERCEAKTCDFEKALLSLESGEARVVIANIDKKYALQLSTQYYAMIKTSPIQRHYLWLVKEWPFPQGMDGAFYVKLAPSFNQEQNFEEPMRSIIQSINYVKHAKDVVENLHWLQSADNFNRNLFYSEIVEHMKGAVKRCNGYVYKKRGSPIIVSNMTISADGQVVMNMIRKPPIDVGCLARGNYVKKCDDDLIMILTFIIIIFCVTMLMITAYFHKSSPIWRSNYWQIH